MTEMYGKIEQLCFQYNTTVTALCRQLGISRSTLSELKSGRTKTLSADYAAKIADYFGISIDFLLGKNPAPPVSAATLSFDDFTYAMHDEGKKLTEENKAKLLEMAKFFVQQQEKERKK